MPIALKPHFNNDVEWFATLWTGRVRQKETVRTQISGFKALSQAILLKDAGDSTMVYVVLNHVPPQMAQRSSRSLRLDPMIETRFTGSHWFAKGLTIFDG